MSAVLFLYIIEYIVFFHPFSYNALSTLPGVLSSYAKVENWYLPTFKIDMSKFKLK